MATYYWVGGSGTWDNVSKANWSASSGGAGGSGPPNNADTAIFNAASGTGTCTTAATAAAAVVSHDGTNITLKLGANFTISGGFTLSSGTLDINSYVLTSLTFVSNSGTTRAIAFGSGSVTVTGNNAVVWNIFNATGLSITGTPVVNATYAGATGTRSLYSGVTAGQNVVNVSFNITAGTDTISFTGPSAFTCKSLDFTGFAGTFANNAISCYGDLKFASGMTVSAGTSGTTFAATSITQKLTTSGKTLDFPVTKTGTGSLQLQDNCTLGVTRTFNLFQGTLDLTGNAGNWTLSAGLFASNNSNTRSIIFGTGNITLTGSGNVWNTSTVTNFSYTGTPTVNVSNNSATATSVTTGALSAVQALDFNYTVGTYTLTDSSSVYKSLNFSGFTGTVANSARIIYGNLTIASGATNSAGANATTFTGTSGTQQITINGATLDYPLTFNGIGGTFAFQDALTQGSTRAFTITNGTVKLKNGVTSTVGAFATSGTNQKFLQSTLAGSQATLSQASGTVSASYLTIQDINATGGATWEAFTANNNVDAGNNLGWDFSTQLGRYIYTRRKNKRILP